VTAYWQNHNWIDMAGLAMAGYAIAEEHPAAERWTALARENFLKVFPLLPEDGSDYEGVVYWRYGVIWLFQYAQLLREAEGIDLFAQSAFLRNTFYYRAVQCWAGLSRTSTSATATTGAAVTRRRVYYKTAAEYGDARLHGANRFAERGCSHSPCSGRGTRCDVKPGILPEACLSFFGTTRP
jgi:hypothetical protein